MEDKKKLDVSKYLEQVMAKEPEWYDYTKTDRGSWQEYYNDAQNILKSGVFNNEMNCLISNIIKNTTMYSENFDQVQHARTAILQLEEFRKRLESIENPNRELINEDPYAGI